MPVPHWISHKLLRACLGALLLFGCVPPKVSLAEGPRAYVPNDYDKILSTWTRSAELLLLGRLENALTVTATYQSWDFRWAYTIRYADDYLLTINQRSEIMSGSLDESRRRHSFYVALYASRWNWSNLTEDDPAWAVRLVDALGNETAAEQIENISRPGATDITYFPYTTPWRRIYRISFPVKTPDGALTISPEARWFGLRFAGAQGHDLLKWELKP